MYVRCHFTLKCEVDDVFLGRSSTAEHSLHGLALRATTSTLSRDARRAVLCDAWNAAR